MAKKGTPTSVNTPNPSIRVALAFLQAPGPDHADSVKSLSGIDVIPGAGAQAIDGLLQAQADARILVCDPHRFRHAHLTEALKQLKGEIHTDCVYTAVSGNQKSRLTEWISGFRNNEHDSHFVVFGSDAFQRFAGENVVPSSPYELCYIAEKTCARYELLVVEDKPAAKTGFGAALKAKAGATVKYYTGGGLKAIHKYLFLALALVLGFTAVQFSKKAGISGDEFTQYEYSKLTANVFLEKVGMHIPIDTLGLKGQKMATLARLAKGEDSAWLATLEDPDRLMHLYGSSFDTFTTILGHVLNVKEMMDFRHMWNAIFGFLCMFYGALIMRRITHGNWKYAWIALVLLFFTPRLLGESLNNPKDVPFALGYIMSLYYAIKAFGNLRLMRISSLLGLIFGTGLGISIRIGGLLSIAIFIMYAGLQFIRQIGWPAFIKFRWTGFLPVLITVVICAVAAFLIGIYPWPYGWEAPLTNPFAALKAFSNYAGSIRQLFGGKIYDSDMLPAHYLATYILITTPVAIMLGWLLNLAVPAWKKTGFRLEHFLVVFAAIFPVVFIFIQKSQVYGGLRHILFTIPCFVLTGLLGYYAIETWLREKKWAQYAIPAAVLGLGALPASFVLRNHPLEYIYFNETVGGVKGAFGQYEMDYYLAGLRPSTEWFLENVARKNPGQKYELLTYGMDQVKYYCRNDKNVHVGFTRYDDRSEKKWDYAIFYNAYLDKTRLLGGHYPPAGTVYSPMVDGKPMGLVLKRPGTQDYEGYAAAEREKNYRLGIEKYQEYLKLDPNSNEVYFYLSTAYANTGNLDSAIWAAKKSVELYPEFTKALFALNQFYINKKDFDNAIKVMEQYLQARPKDAEAWWVKSQCEAGKGNLPDAVISLHTAIEISPLDGRFYNTGSQIYAAMKDNINAGLYSTASQLNSAKDQATQQKALSAIMGIYNTITGKDLDLSKFQ
ncbi:MAG: tetratricopeptide repeat protein [Bacteroidetes bacterium]|nr:tetratricopeptide repeat protein [Bacteroidota bacterium]